MVSGWVGCLVVEFFWLIDCSRGRLVCRLVGCFVYQLVLWLKSWLNDLLEGYSFRLLIDWFVEWLITQLFCCLCRVVFLMER